MRVADLLARALSAAGARHLFALSGNHVMPVFDAALDAKLSLLHVRHEAAAVHMADAWGRLTGSPGIALVTGGPGHANAISALYTALASESPLILISGHAPLAELGKGAFQEMRQSDMASPVTKASWTVRSAERLGEDLVRAWREAISGTPGPVHLSIPSDVLEAKLTAPLPGANAFAVLEEPVQEPSVLDALAAAKQPLILTGPMFMRMRERARGLEDITGIPVIGMESPRGVHDPSLGRLAEVLKRADVVLLLGKRLDFTLKFGEAFSPSCRVLQAHHNLAGWTRHTWRKSGWRDEVRAALAYRPAEWSAIDSKPDGAVHPVQLCREVQKLLQGPDAVFVSDGGEFGQWAQACLSAPARIINGPAGGIGSALPFAAAAKLARPDAPVVATLGDGTFGFHTAEIDTAVRYGLNYIAVVGNDATWNAEYQIQLRAYGKERAKGCELLPTRYGAVAAAMGAHGEDVLAFRDLLPALGRAERAGKPACVNVMIERLPAPKY
jgi:acetolactate synthase-1/2/3 large subunit